MILVVIIGFMQVFIWFGWKHAIALAKPLKTNHGKRHPLFYADSHLFLMENIWNVSKTNKKQLLYAETDENQQKSYKDNKKQLSGSLRESRDTRQCREKMVLLQLFYAFRKNDWSAGFH